MCGCKFSVYPFPLWWLKEYIYLGLSSSSNRKYELISATKYKNIVGDVSCQGIRGHCIDLVVSRWSPVLWIIWYSWYMIWTDAIVFMVNLSNILKDTIWFLIIAILIILLSVYMSCRWSTDFCINLKLNCYRHILPEANFGLRVLSSPVSMYLSVCLCVCINHLLVRKITHQPFKLESANFEQRCKTPWYRSLLFWGMIDFDLQGQI